MTIISLCPNCFALREDQVAEGAVIPHHFLWHGACARCQQTVMYDFVGLRRCVPAAAPDDLSWLDKT